MGDKGWTGALYAHSRDDLPKEQWQTLGEHLEGVGELARQFGRAFHAEGICHESALLHDAGKASRKFQKRIEGLGGRVDHSTAGAIIARERFGVAGALMAPVIAGHHGGLPNWSDESGLRTSLMSRFSKAYISSSVEGYERFFDVVHPDPSEVEDALQLLGSSCKLLNEYLFSLFTFTRLVYSSLVDADWLDTERFMCPGDFQIRSYNHATLEEMSRRLDQHLSNLANGSGGNPEVHAARQAVQENCRRAARQPNGIFTLEVPTGGGKTLASLRFALDHAMKNGHDRIIYAIPFTSIVEQNAAVFKNVLGDDQVLEHHSNFDFGNLDDEDSLRRRLLVQNWDAPLVVTTNVQLFESLFSNKPSRSRKVHNVANSVIILDEAQTLPDRLLKPTLAMLESLCKIANVSVVFCTATQPALDQQWPFGSEVHPIIADPESLRAKLDRRTVIDTERINQGAWSTEHGTPYSLDDLCKELRAERQVLCIVSSRRAARLIYDKLRDGTSIDGVFHLSALMVPAHRSLVLEQVCKRLAQGLPCRVISTQLIEAGVDVDFPVVFREMAGIDSVLQAAGRCNREGRLRHPGLVHVFECPEFSRCGSRKNWLDTIREIGREIVQEAEREGFDAFGPTGVKHYFQMRYDNGDSSRSNSIMGGITDWQILGKDARTGLFEYRCEFENVANEYQFIDNDNTVEVFVPWGDEGKTLYGQIESNGIYLGVRTRLQRYLVQIPCWMIQSYRDAGVIRDIEGILVLEDELGAPSYYSDETGLCQPGEEAAPPEVLVL